jgi:hypothetical protein
MYIKRNIYPLFKTFFSKQYNVKSMFKEEEYKYFYIKHLTYKNDTFDKIKIETCRKNDIFEKNYKGNVSENLSYDIKYFYAYKYPNRHK